MEYDGRQPRRMLRFYHRCADEHSEHRPHFVAARLLWHLSYLCILCGFRHELRGVLSTLDFFLMFYCRHLTQTAGIIFGLPSSKWTSHSSSGTWKGTQKIIIYRRCLVRHLDCFYHPSPTPFVLLKAMFASDYIGADWTQITTSLRSTVSGKNTALSSHLLVLLFWSRIFATDNCVYLIATVVSPLAVEVRDAVNV